MYAIFKTSTKVAAAHAEFAGLVVCKIPPTGTTPEEDADKITLAAWDDTDAMIIANGAPHAVTRLIGAFADDGMDCLVRASN